MSRRAFAYGLTPLHWHVGAGVPRWRGGCGGSPMIGFVLTVAVLVLFSAGVICWTVVAEES